jgi:type III pantothenate kinase
MTFVVDIGNTNIVCGVYMGTVLAWHCRIKTEKSRTSDEYYALISSLMANSCSPKQIDNVLIASVVPDLTRMWIHLFQKFFTAQIHILSGYSNVGLTYVVKDPGFIGADLIANALAAWKKYNTSCLIIDLGTATTIQLVTASGEFLGAIIAPGVMTSSENLFTKASLLTATELTCTNVILGTSTKDALLSGIINGHSFMLKGFVELIKAEYKASEPITTIATGGIAELICSNIDSINYIDKTLTLDGLYLASQILSNAQASER